MKKKIIISIIVSVVLLSGITAFMLLNPKDEISVFVSERETKVASVSKDGETYISAEDIFSEANIDYGQENGKIVAKGTKTLEIDKKNNAVKINGEKSPYDFKNEKGEVMISPYLAGEIIGGEVALDKDKIYIVETKPVTVKFRENGKKIEFGYSDNMFLPSSYEYNHALAKMSLGASVASFSAKEADKYWGDKGDYGRDANIISLLKDMGFSNIKTYNYDKSLNDISDTTAFALGEKEIQLGNKKYRLIGAFVRGGAYGNEWVSNFNLGKSENHQGFSASADEAVKIIKAYAEENKTDSKLWISGFSRGAGVANLAAASLCDYFGGENIYAYTFATPNTTTNTEKNSEKYGYIFNIANKNDLVPLIPPSFWGYGKFGREVSFPPLSKYSEETAKSLSDKIDEIYQSISSAGSFNMLEIENSNQREQVNSTVSSVVTAIGGLDNYERGISPVMRDFIQIKNTKKKDKNGVWQWMTAKEGIEYLFKNEGENILLKAEQDGFLTSVENAFGEIGQQVKAFGAVCIKNGRDPYKVITEEIGVGNLITIASIFVPDASSGTIAKTHYPESYMAIMLGITDPSMLVIE